MNVPFNNFFSWFKLTFSIFLFICSTNTFIYKTTAATMNNITTKFRTLRELHNYKQDYVASILGITQSGYAKLENGDIGNISLKYLQKLAELYQLNLEQLLDWDGKINIGTVNGVGVNQGTTHLYAPSDERIKELEEKLEKLLDMVSK